MSSNGCCFSFNKGQILHLAQGSLYVRDELSYVFAGIVPFYIHFPQRSVTKIDIMSKFRIFSSKWHIFYLNKHLQFMIFVPKWRLWFFATGTAVELPNLWVSFFLNIFLSIFLKYSKKLTLPTKSSWKMMTLEVPHMRLKIKSP